MDSKQLLAASTAEDKLCVIVLANNMEEGLFGGSYKMMKVRLDVLVYY